MGSATEHVLDLSEEHLRQSLSGKDVHIPSEDHGDLLLAMPHPSGKRMVVGRGMLKQGKILNRLPRDIVRMFS